MTYNTFITAPECADKQLTETEIVCIQSSKELVDGMVPALRNMSEAFISYAESVDWDFADIDADRLLQGKIIAASVMARQEELKSAIIRG
jgi:hypothetical protein